MRPNDRQPDELRPLRFKRRYTRQAPGSVLVMMGRTTVLCTCCVETSVPPFLVGKGKGWMSAEYGMLPGSTSERKQRDATIRPAYGARKPCSRWWTSLHPAGRLSLNCAVVASYLG